VKVISKNRGEELRLRIGDKDVVKAGTVSISGHVTSENYVLGRTLREAEKNLGLRLNELKDGGFLCRLNRLPKENEFKLAPGSGYTNVPSMKGYPSGQGANQWVLTKAIPAKVTKFTKTGNKLGY
jgi:hypothetical protein